MSDSERNETTVEAEDDPTQEYGFGAERGDVISEGSLGSEIVWAEAEVHEYPVGDGGVRRRRRRSGGSECCSGGDGERGGCG